MLGNGGASLIVQILQKNEMIGRQVPQTVQIPVMN